MTNETVTARAPRTVLAFTKDAVFSVNGGLGMLLLIAVVIFTLLGGARFASIQNVRSMAFQMPEFGLLAMAMAVTLLTGGLNLSIIATSNLCALTMAYVMVTASGAGAPPLLGEVLGVIAGLAVGVLVGLLNGYLIAYLRVSPILTTIGTMTLLRGLAIGLTHGSVISGVPSSILAIGSGSVFGIPISLILFGLCALVVAIMLNRTAMGTFMYMMGSNERATYFSGVDTKGLVLRVYVLSGLLCAVAGLVMLARFNSANATYGEAYLLGTILAAALGGVNMNGGFGKVFGVVLALVILQVISSAFNQLAISPYLTLAIWGAILIATACARL
jgi:ribose/xylose/arabinose/galactoside ABC-type transport system permease subunit